MVGVSDTTVSGTPLNTHLFGPTDAPEVLALHGLTGHGRRWRNLAEQHLPDVRVIAPDLRGHGRSPGRRRGRSRRTSPTCSPCSTRTHAVP